MSISADTAAEGIAPTADGLAQLARRREAALLRKFVSCGLLPAEMAELKDLLPLSVLTHPPEPRPGYFHIYKHYAELLRVGERQIKRLVEIGGAAVGGPDFPPFDEPSGFLPWWRRCMKDDPGAHVLAFASSGAKDVSATVTALAGASVASAPASGVTPPSSPATSAAPPCGTTPPTGAPAASIGFDLTGAGGFEGSVAELRATVASAQRRLRDAMLANPLNESLVASCNRTVREQLDLLRKSENDLFAFQQLRGELVPKTEIREDWRTLLSALRRMRERMEANVTGALAKTAQFTAEQLALVKIAVGAERAREDQLLRSSKFWLRSSDVSPVA